MGGELRDASLHCGGHGVDLSNPPPIVLLALEVAHGEVTCNEANGIASKEVKQEVIPPAFNEVWQVGLEGVLQHLKQKRSSKGQPDISEHESLCVPSQCMGEDELIHSAHQVCPRE